MNRISSNSHAASIAKFSSHHLLVCALGLVCSLLLALPISAAARQAVNEITTSGQIQTKTAIIHELKGSAILREISKPVSPIQLNQKLLDGDILDVAKDSLVEITYNNGCSEIVGQAKSHKIDACACQTSPFRKGIKDLFNATLKDIVGEVLVFQGEKYVPASGNMRVRNGDRIMVMRNAAATIAFDTGCKQDVGASSIHDVDGCSLECPLVDLVDRLPNQPIPTTQTPPVQPPPAPLPPGPVPAAVPPAPIPPTPIPPVPAPIPAVNPGLIATASLPPLKVLILDPYIFDKDEDNDKKRAVSP